MYLTIGPERKSGVFRATFNVPAVQPLAPQPGGLTGGLFIINVNFFV